MSARFSQCNGYQLCPMWISRAVILVATMTLSSGIAQTRVPADQQKFFGKWTLSEPETKKIHPNRDGVSDWRSYEPDGDRVKVSWGTGNTQTGTYSAKCDGIVEPISTGKIRCQQTAPGT